MNAPSEQLRRTPLFALHSEVGARMGPSPATTCRSSIRPACSRSICTRAVPPGFSMFRIWARSRCGRATAISPRCGALERLVPIDVLGLAAGRQRYAVFTNEQGGIIDDLMIGNRGDHFR